MRRIFTTDLLTIAVFVSVLATDASGAVQTWRDADGGSITGELIAFHPEEKAMVLEEPDGTQHTMPTEKLAFSSQVKLLFSPGFLQSFPEERWSAQRNRLLLSLVAITCLFLLAGFWLAAIIVFRKLNPVKAIIGWVGSVAFAGFLFYVYLTAARKFHETGTGLLVAGGVVGAICASVFVSVIYDSKILKAGVLFTLHFVLAALLVGAAYYGLGRYEVPEEARRFFTDYVLIPVGLL